MPTGKGKAGLTVLPVIKYTRTKRGHCFFKYSQTQPQQNRMSQKPNAALKSHTLQLHFQCASTREINEIGLPGGKKKIPTEIEGDNNDGALNLCKKKRKKKTHFIGV